MKKAYTDIAGKLVILSAVFGVLTVVISTLLSGTDSTVATKILVVALSSVPVFAVSLIFAFGILNKNKGLLVGWYILSVLGQITKFFEMFFIKSSVTGGFSEPRNFEAIPSYLSDIFFYVAMVVFILSAMTESKNGGEQGKSSFGSAAVFMFIGAAFKFAGIIPIAVYSDSYSVKDIVISCICACLVAVMFILFGIGIKNGSKNYIWIGVAVEVVGRVISQFTSGANVFSNISSVISAVLFDVGEAMFIIYLLENTRSAQNKGQKILK